MYCVSLGKGLSGDAWSTLMDNWFALYETRVHIGTSRWIIRNTKKRECRGRGGKGNYEERKKVVWEKVRKTDKWTSYAVSFVERRPLHPSLAPRD